VAFSPRNGNQIFKSFKVWEYWYDKEDMLIYHYKGNQMDIYSQSLDPQYINRPNCFSTSSTNIQAAEMGDTIKRMNPTIIGVQSSSKPAPLDDDPESFLDVVKG
jgi:Fe-S cluster biosynthesis and repair protein YggX